MFPGSAAYTGLSSAHKYTIIYKLYIYVNYHAGEEQVPLSFEGFIWGRFFPAGGKIVRVKL